jgi:hypothetical protein
MVHTERPDVVLMGDLVNSEHNGATTLLHERFNAVIRHQNARHRDAIASPLTITLGDEFQGLITSFAAAIEIARDIRFDLLEDAIDCRFAIGAIRLETPLNTERAWNMMGPGLAETRERLNEKRPSTYYGFTLPDHPILEVMLEASGASLTAIERGWTETQRGDIRALLSGRSPAEIARSRNVSVHTVYKVRNSGDFDLYRIHWDAIRQALAFMDEARPA